MFRIQTMFCVSLLALLAGALMACGKPDFKDSHGQGISLKDDQGRWQALNIWAEWCDPCREEIPELNAVYQSDAVRVLGYDFDGSQGSELGDKIKRLAIAFPVLAQQPYDALGTSAPRALPATFILDPEGKLMETLYGPQTQNTIEQTIRKQQKKVTAGG